MEGLLFYYLGDTRDPSFEIGTNITRSYILNVKLVM